MSKRILTNLYSSKMKHLFLAFTLTIIASFTVNEYSDPQNRQVQRLSSCMAIKSNLPMNHTNHPCYVSNMSNKSWISWLSGDSKSTHLHFLDLNELIHSSFN